MLLRHLKSVSAKVIEVIKNDYLYLIPKKSKVIYVSLIALLIVWKKMYLKFIINIFLFLDFTGPRYPDTLMLAKC